MKGVDAPIFKLSVSHLYAMLESMTERCKKDGAMPYAYVSSKLMNGAAAPGISFLQPARDPLKKTMWVFEDATLLQQVPDIPQTKLNLGQLRHAVGQMKYQIQHGSKRDVLYVTVRQHPNGNKFIEFEQPSHYAECNSTYYRFDCQPPIKNIRELLER